MNLADRSGPKIGITMGDPAGVGPEIVVRAFADANIRAKYRPVVIGSRWVLERAMEFCRISIPVEAADIPSINGDALALCEVECAADIPCGTISEAAGMAAYRYIERAVDMALQQRLDAVVTAPIHKEALRAAGIEHAGHTEILAALTNSYDPLTMFEVDDLRIFFLSRHVSLKKACELVTCARVYEYIIRCTEAMRCLGLNNTLLVAALNPHGGEHGLFGTEETEEIEPAVQRARNEGIRVVGPIPADSAFHIALRDKATVLSLYHDQGHIAAKTLAFHKTISVTLGLPFVRTSVDHGTAMDIAGSGKASAVSMIAAIAAAAKYARSYERRSLCSSS